MGRQPHAARARSLIKIWRAIRAYFAASDPRLGIATLVAFIVASDQPFYPFLVWYAVGAPVPAAFLTWLWTPLFLAAPALARRSADAGRTLLLVAALGNTVLAAWALGPQTGVELFYLPCLVVAWASWPPGKRRRPTALTGAAVVAGLLLVRRIGVPLAGLTPAQAHGLTTMHAISVAGLTLILAVRAFSVARAERLNRNAGSPAPRSLPTLP